MYSVHTIIRSVLNMNKIKCLLFFIISKLLLGESAKILGVVPMPSYSHQVTYQLLWKELSLRGHQVTVLTTHPQKDPELTNLTEIDLSSTVKTLDDNVMDIVNKNKNTIENLRLMGLAFANCSNTQLSHPKVQELMNKNQQFDLVMAEPYMPAALAFSVKFKCPLISLFSTDAPEVFHQIIGNPSHPVLNPGFILQYISNLNFLQRLVSTVFTTSAGYLNNLFFLNSGDALIRKHFGKDYPTSRDIILNSSLYFVNTHIAFRARSILPTTLLVGPGLHRHPSRPLPKDLQQYLDKSHNGFIYFSLGSSIKTKNLSKDILSVILDTFAELPYNILWKFELEDLPEKPNNVLISKWFPQQDILKHPNIKLFITQGGYQSLEEAIFDHVPILGLPIFVDQPGNIRFVVCKGMGLSLDHNTLDKATFKIALLEVINNPRYRENVKKFATLALDQPMTGLEQAIWWTEYVLRHKGAYHLKRSLSGIPAYQYYLLDVIGFFVLFMTMIVFVLKILKRIIRKNRIKTK